MKKTIKILFFVLGLLILFFANYYFFFIKERKPAENVNITNNNIENAKKIIAVGDSLTAGYGLPLSESYPAQLEKKLTENKYNVKVINAGISGETTAGLLERVEFIKSNNPYMILITIGGNDALRNLPIENTEANIFSIIKSFKEILPAERIFLMKMKSPLNAGLLYASKFNEMYEKVAKQEGINLVPFLETEVFLNSNLMLEDRIHPNADGYKFLIDKYIYKAVARSL